MLLSAEKPPTRSRKASYTAFFARMVLGHMDAATRTMSNFGDQRTKRHHAAHMKESQRAKHGLKDVLR